MTINSSSRFGYDEFYSSYLLSQDNKVFVENSPFPLPLPNDFSHNNARHCCLAALHGLSIHPPSEAVAKKTIKSNKQYGKVIAARVELFENLVQEFNIKQVNNALFTGVIFKITIDANSPVLEPDFFPLVASLGGSTIIKALDQYHNDRKYSTFGQAARLNHFAQEYGFINFNTYKVFLSQLDLAAQELGFPSYKAICTPSDYLMHIQQLLIKDESNPSLLHNLKEKNDLLQRQSVFTIERYIACRNATQQDDFEFHVDVTTDEVAIKFKKGTNHVEFYISSVYISNSSDEYLKIWSDEITSY